MGKDGGIIKKTPNHPFVAYMNNEELWKAVLGEIELSISKANFVTWFRNTGILSCENGKVVISVPSIFAREWLENKYNHYILSALQRHRSDISEITCSVQPSSDKSQSLNGPSSAPVSRPVDAIRSVAGGAASSPPVSVVGMTGAIASAGPSPQTPQNSPAGGYSPGFSRPMTRLPERPANLNPRYVFESFIVGEGNELARAACYAVSQNLGNLYNPLFIYGGVGLGKTHLLQAIGNQVMAQSPEKVIKYIHSERFTNELIEAIKNQTMNAFKEVYQKVDVLLIDDVQFLSGREKTQNELFHIFNTLYQINKQIVFTSDRPPQSIPTIEDRLRSRFMGGMMADVSRPNLETRLAILNLKMADKPIQLDQESARFIAENITSNIRELEGALNRVVASCEFQRIPPSLAYTKKILGPIVVETRKQVSIDTIAKAVAEFYHIDAEDLMKKTRKKEVSHPRQVAMYLIRTELKSPLAAIGRYFGGRDHTTTLHACNKVERDIAKNGQFNEEIKNLKEKIYRTDEA